MIASPYTKEFDALVAELGGSRQNAQEDGAWAITDGEVDFILEGEVGSWVLTKKTRDVGSFVMSASDIIDIERYLTYVYGSCLRGLCRLPTIMAVGVTPAGIAPVFSLVEVSPGKVALLRQDGSIRAVLSGNMHSSAGLAVKFSWIADASLEDLRVSYRDPNGLPLFPGLTMYQPARVLGQVDGAGYTGK